MIWNGGVDTPLRTTILPAFYAHFYVQLFVYKTYETAIFWNKHQRLQLEL